MTSIRSSSGAGMVSSVFAVVTNSTFDKSYGSSRYRSRKELFCSGSSTSKSALAGSPRISEEILSISSSRITGLIVPALFMAYKIRPGIAPIYVRRCPRISASSFTPPRLMRTNFLPSARAIERAMLVLPTPGGPTKHRIGAFILPVSFKTARYSQILSLIFSSA